MTRLGCRQGVGRRQTIRRIARYATLVSSLWIAATGQAAGGFHDQLLSAVRAGESLTAGDWNYQAETAFVGRLDELADAFDRLTTQARVSAGDASSFVRLLERTHARYAGVLESMQSEVIRIDGDLEAVQDSPAWREHELLAMRVLYRLNWIRYQTATSLERNPEIRKALLHKALSGFAEFVGAEQASLRVEALLGHGLSAKALKRYGAAVADFRAALAEKAEAEMVEGLRIALAESLLATGDIATAVTESAQLTASGMHPSPLAWFVRAKTLVVALGDATRRNDRSAEASLLSVAGPALDRLCGFGGSWRKKSGQLIDAGLDRPQRLADSAVSTCTRLLVGDVLRRRGDCSTAEEIYDALWEKDEDKAEVAFGRGNCRFRNGDFDGASSDFGFFLEHAPRGDSRRSETRYLAFKSAEALYIDAGQPAAGPAAERYLEALEAFLQNAVSHSRAYEGWYRLGEWHRSHEDYASCHEAFSRVSAPIGLAFEAHFLGAQCLVEEASRAKHDESEAARLAAAAVAALDTVVEEFHGLVSASSTLQPRPPAALAAKAALMAATLSRRVEGGGPEAVLERLSGFDVLAAGRHDLLAKARMLQIGAERGLGRWREATSHVRGLLDLPEDAGVTVEALKTLALALLRDTETLERNADARNAAITRDAARAVYVHLLDRDEAGRIKLDGQTRAAISRLIDRLDSSGTDH